MQPPSHIMGRKEHWAALWSSRPARLTAHWLPTCLTAGRQNPSPHCRPHQVGFITHSKGQQKPWIQYEPSSKLRKAAWGVLSESPTCTTAGTLRSGPQRTLCSLSYSAEEGSGLGALPLSQDVTHSAHSVIIFDNYNQGEKRGLEHTVPSPL
jgi:hypothetical protein